MIALIRVTGAVQGVGYRPFVAELASKYKLDGEVKNCGGIVDITVCGDKDVVHAFADELKHCYPHGSMVIDVSLKEISDDEPEGQIAFSGFHIVQSTDNDGMNVLPVFPPDIGLCPDCYKELIDKKDRRYRYPLISCTSCGPRYSILKKLPYDRENITMDVYPMCSCCKEEYKKGRRRHAQTISCHDCGPQMIFVHEGEVLHGDDAVEQAISILKDDGIIGLKGIGGYQLVCKTNNTDTVKRLREIKGREKKPFAVMFPDAGSVKDYCVVSDLEEKYLSSDAKPIVLLDKAGSNTSDMIPKEVTGSSAQIGAFLPASGIHVLLTNEIGPLIVTSGNISGSPMIVSDTKFSDIFLKLVDGILYYEREIKRPMDDSVMSVAGDKPRYIRRARGYVPMSVFLRKPLKENTLFISFGADLKNTFSIGYGDRIICSQFFGDMEEMSVSSLQKKEIAEALRIFGAAELKVNEIDVICDMHPAYISAQNAGEFCKLDPSFLLKEKEIAFLEDHVRENEISKVQHHHAHIGSVMAEAGITECIGIAFDGTGYGTDGTIWGSEVLVCKKGEFERAEHLKPVKIVGSDEAMKNAAASATCFLADAGIQDITLLPENEDMLINAALNAGINAYPNSGMGRLFDAVSAILGAADYNSYEGECAICLQNKAEEYVKECREADKEITDKLLLFGTDEKTLEWNTAELIRDIADRRPSQSAGEISYMFHNTLANAVLKACLRIREQSGIKDVCLSGGVFANRLLLNLCSRYLQENGFVIYLNSILPTNDGGISVGQIYLESLRKE